MPQQSRLFATPLCWLVTQHPWSVVQLVVAAFAAMAMRETPPPQSAPKARTD
jgi:hypothetical protein